MRSLFARAPRPSRRRPSAALAPATGTTGFKVASKVGLPVTCLLSGPDGGDAQIGARVAEDRVAAVIFLMDPLSAQAHEPDINSLLRLCNVHRCPLATNVASAEYLLVALHSRLLRAPAKESASEALAA